MDEFVVSLDEKDICDDDVLTHSSREVLFHITGFYQWLVNSSESNSLMTDKTSVRYVPWKPHIEWKWIEYSKSEYQDIRGHTRDCMEKQTCKCESVYKQT